MFNPAFFYKSGVYTTDTTIITVDTRNIMSGSSNANSLRLPFYGSADCVVDWGDGTVEDLIRLDNSGSAYAEHYYVSPGIYDIKIVVGVNKIFLFYISNSADRLKFIGFKKFGAMTLVNSAFLGATNLKFNECSDYPRVFSGNLVQCFRDSGVDLLPLLERWKLPAAAWLDSFFYNTSFNDNINMLDVSEVIRMESMFRGNKVFNKIISNWNVSNVLNMSLMFSGATAFNQDISMWNFNKNVTLTNFMGGKSSANYNPLYYDSLLQKFTTRFIGTGRTVGKTLGMGTIKYTSVGKPYRDALVADGWTITDGGQI